MLKYAYKVLWRKIKTIINYEVFKSYYSSFYDGRRLYQYNKDDFLLKFSFRSLQVIIEMLF